MDADYLARCAGRKRNLQALGLLAVVFLDHAGQHDGQHRAQRDEYRQHNQDRNAADGLFCPYVPCGEKRPGRSFRPAPAPRLRSFRILSAIYRCLLLSQITRPAISTSAGITITAMAAMVYISAVLREAQGVVHQVLADDGDGIGLAVHPANRAQQQVRVARNAVERLEEVTKPALPKTTILAPASLPSAYRSSRRAIPTFSGPLEVAFLLLHDRGIRGPPWRRNPRRWSGSPGPRCRRARWPAAVREVA